MKNMHIHIAVDDLSKSVGFYSALFGAAPTIKRDDYAKWQLEDPRVNFAISVRDGLCGMNHLGIQVDSEVELQEIAARLAQAEVEFSSQEGTSCCGSHANKHWALDPQGIAWESFRTLGASPVFGGREEAGLESSSECCVPLRALGSGGKKADCCVPNQNDATGCCS